MYARIVSSGFRHPASPHCQWRFLPLFCAKYQFNEKWNSNQKRNYPSKGTQIVRKLNENEIERNKDMHKRNKRKRQQKSHMNKNNNGHQTLNTKHIRRTKKWKWQKLFGEDFCRCCSCCCCCCFVAWVTKVLFCVYSFRFISFFLLVLIIRLLWILKWLTLAFCFCSLFLLTKYN